MGAFLSSSSPSSKIADGAIVVENSAKVLPETLKSQEGKILIRHRPTCLSTDLEKGIAEQQENLVQPDTKSP